jgi:hypothetical protein
MKYIPSSFFVLAIVVVVQSTSFACFAPVIINRFDPILIANSQARIS